MNPWAESQLLSCAAGLALLPFSYLKNNFKLILTFGKNKKEKKKSSSSSFGGREKKKGVEQLN